MSWLAKLVAVVAALSLVTFGTAYARNAPVAAVITPTAGASVPVGVPVLFTGIAVNGETGGITSVELSVDGGSTWVEVGTTESWRYVYTPTEVGDLTVVSRAATAAGMGEPTAPRTVHVGSTGPLRPISGLYYFLLPDAVSAADTDAEPVEVGMRTRFDRPGSITGVALRRGSYAGPITVRVWSSAGVLLGEQVTAESRIMLTTPVPVTADEDYVVSYYTPEGGYRSSEHYFTGTVVSMPFTAPHDGVSGAGVYRYGVGGGFPTDTWHDSNYWIAPYFQR
ncbi:DUF4082 domain-containing protein [Umezawaea sp.]|uniref:DUF4082 domain-containing protein n=1 Tax=Umezawaea sp. TaxID=1955258 RepID=UPI002ED346C1